ncbi:hypothetical protein DENSPDRAFT_878816 [Dentipellis sp. KUC8613]|nr:hypothetical protein DENSPDRAFT_878816 [Dentipellis sp. KUC8613]
MAQATKVTIRPPPNVDFVQGYPGIPPGAPDRPQAAVKGVIEVRMGPQGIKAKYVRIELRKIETLPGGGTQNSFFDYVGQSPINLWQSSEEFSALPMKDIPFYIRIPESIPPTLTLERGAGVKYELVGQMCVQGKSGFFRRNKSIILTSSTPIIIDKHELHSSWPIYQQPESRDLVQDAVVLTVERTQNCYGPGDRVTVTATVKSDSLHTVILRGFEFTLKETTIFRAGPHTTGKKAAPQVKINIIGEQKMPVNATLYGGTSHRAQLSCAIPQSHTTATLTSARHIDINYVCIVKALMGTGKPLITELPVIVSNWPRYVSVEAIRRIGNAPTLTLQNNATSLDHSSPATRPYGASGVLQTQTLGERIRSDSVDLANGFGQPRAAQTMPAINGHAPTNSIGGRTDEFGVVGPGAAGRNATSLQARPRTAESTGDTSTGSASGGGGASANTVGSRTPRTRASTMGQTNRFTIVNVVDNEIPEEDDALSVRDAAGQGQGQGQGQAPAEAGSGSAAQQQQQATPAKAPWLTAEEEKARLYQQAKAEVERTQNRIERTPSPQQQTTTPPATGSPGHWPTAEEEKVRLFNQAQSNARIMQSYAAQDTSGGGMSHGRTDSRESARAFQTPAGAGKPAVSAGAALYSAAMSSMNKQRQNPSVPTTPPQAQPHPGTGAGTPHLPSAQEEKEMLRRYQHAKTAVSRHQDMHFGPDDVASGSSPGYAPAPANGDDLPPPWVPSSDYHQSQPPSAPASTEPISEKERYRRAQLARDAAAAQMAGMAPPPPPPAPAPVPAQPMSAAEEKELLRRQYAAQDAGPQMPVPVPHPAPAMGAPPPFHASPPPAPGEVPAHVRARAQPAPPTGSSSRPMTAAEEKAMLRARYEAEERGGAGGPPSPPQFGSSASPAPLSAGIPSAGLSSAGMPSAGPPPAPYQNSSPAPYQNGASTPPHVRPPLMPRPPEEYIRETREEDARSLARAQSIASTHAPSLPMSALASADAEDDTFGLKLRPTSPFTIGLDGMQLQQEWASAAPPPRPPKVALDS